MPPKSRTIHGVLSNPIEEFSPQYHKGLLDYINSPDFDNDTYVKLLSGEYHEPGLGPGSHSELLLDKSKEEAIKEAEIRATHPWSGENEKRLLDGGHFAHGALIDHPANNPENNSKVLAALQDQKNALNEAEWSEGDKYGDLRTHGELDSIIHPILKNGKLKKEDIAKHFENPGFAKEIVQNKNLDQNSYNYSINSIDPSKITDSHIDSPFFNESHVKKIFASENNPSHRVAKAIAEKGMLSPEHAKRMLMDEDSVDNADSYLSALTEKERKSFLDKKLGIEGGSQIDDEVSNEDNWMNWQHGPDHDPKGPWASSKYITDDQAEHVKRHGSYGEKKTLFENPSVDPKHGAEMWKKWDEDESDHGYSFDDWKNDYKETMEDSGNIAEKFGDEGRRRAEEAYSLDDYINDTHDNGRVYDNDYLEDHIINNSDKFDTIHDNPDFDAKSPEHPRDNPRHIDFADQSSGGGHSYNLSDHPDYDGLLEEAEAQVRQEKGVPDSVHEGYQDSINESEFDHAHEAFEESLDDFHKNWSNLPSHLKGKIPGVVEARRKDRLDETKSAIKAHDLDKPYSVPGEAAKLWTKDGLKDYFIPRIKDELLPTSHDYAPGLHHAEMIKDYADANGGRVDLGSLVKRHPNLKERFKQILGDKQSITSQEAQKKIDDMPKTRYGISMRSWGANNMQNINGNDQLVVRLDHSPESYKQFESDPGLMDTFRKIQDASQASGHPSNEDSIAWARIDTSNPKHWMIDEVQSDFGSSLRRQIENAEHANPEVKAKLLEHLGKIEGAHKDWRENIMNYVVKMAKKHGVEQISTHSPESKAAHTGAQNVHTVYKDSYQKIPRQMGFTPVEADQLPLSDQGKRIFARNTDSKPKFTEQELEGRTPDQHIQKLHHDAMEHHLRQAKIHSEFSSAPNQGSLFDAEAPKGFTPGTSEHHAAMFEHHKKQFFEHKRKAMQHDPTNFYSKNVKFDEYGSKDVGSKDLEAAAETISAGSPSTHDGDTLLDAKSSSKLHPGHTLDLRSTSFKLKKSELEFMGEVFALKLMNIL